MQLISSQIDPEERWQVEMCGDTTRARMNTSQDELSNIMRGRCSNRPGTEGEKVCGVKVVQV